MAVINSPLRYPGGKSSLSTFLASLLEVNGISNGVYVEPYAGGAGAAITLLLRGQVDRIVINDYDKSIYAFWNALITEPDSFMRLVADTPVTIPEWHRQKSVFLHPDKYSEVAVGFATFFLNRCNHSGIIKANPIGGLKQKSKYSIGARYNKKGLLNRLERIAAVRHKIEIFNLDAIELLAGPVTELAQTEQVLVYLDPPYYVKGSQLYLNYYTHDDHATLAAYMQQTQNFYWAITYDDVKEIRQLYSWACSVDFNLNYFAHKPKKGCELLIAPHTLALPESIDIKYGLA